MDIEAKKLQKSLIYTIGFIVLIWVIRISEWTLSIDLGEYGILPRTAKGALGIITGPLIHGDFSHLISNTFPLLFLGIAVIYFYNSIAANVLIWIYVITGLWVWIMGREAYHIGASGIVYGLVSFLFFSGLFRRDSYSLAIALIIIFMYGGMFYGIFPTNARISFESHLFGSLAGILCAFYYRRAKVGLLKPVAAEEDDENALTDSEFTSLADNPKDVDFSGDNNVTFTYTYRSKKESEG